MTELQQCPPLFAEGGLLSSRHLESRCRTKFRQSSTGSVVIQCNVATMPLSQSTVKQKNKKLSSFHGFCTSLWMSLRILSQDKVHELCGEQISHGKYGRGAPTCRHKNDEHVSVETHVEPSGAWSRWRCQELWCRRRRENSLIQEKVGQVAEHGEV